MPRTPPRTGRTINHVLGFLVLFLILVLLTAKFYLIPALGHLAHATHAQKRKIAAHSLLLLVILLTILLVGLLLTFRISRFFFPPPNAPRVRTKYVDAWQISGERLTVQTPPESDETE